MSSAPTVGEVKDFLLSVMDSADDRQSKVNPSFTKEQIWNLFMGNLMNKEDDSPYTVPMGLKHINKEFGGTFNE